MGLDISNRLFKQVAMEKGVIVHNIKQTCCMDEIPWFWMVTEESPTALVIEFRRDGEVCEPPNITLPPASTCTVRAPSKFPPGTSFPNGLILTEGEIVLPGDDHEWEED